MKKIGLLIAVASAFALDASAAFGDTFAVDTTAYLTVAGVILTALGGFWVVTKTLGLASR